MAIDDILNEGRRSFRTRWLGYDRDQVDEAYAKLEHLLGSACADRDAALATAEDLNRHLEEARTELTEYRKIHAGYNNENAVSGCIRYLLHVARQKAEEIEAGARTRAENAARLLDEAEQESQRRLAEANQRAREIVGEALEQSRLMLADLAERQRLLDHWYDEVATTPNLPLPRHGEPVLATVERTDVPSVTR
jgi:cell division septum initiation protein DivIVA